NRDDAQPIRVLSRTHALLTDASLEQRRITGYDLTVTEATQLLKHEPVKRPFGVEELLSPVARAVLDRSHRAIREAEIHYPGMVAAERVPRGFRPSHPSESVQRADAHPTCAVLFDAATRLAPQSLTEEKRIAGPVRNPIDGIL